MGYDDDECLSCYCGDGGGGNNPTDDTARTCMGCINRITEDYQSYPRVMNAIKSWSGEYGDCERCGRRNRYVYNIPTCDFHSRIAPQYGLSESSNDSDDSSESSDNSDESSYE